MARNVALAVDLGASSGRIVSGSFDGRLLELSYGEGRLHLVLTEPVTSRKRSPPASGGSVMTVRSLSKPPRALSRPV